MEALSPSPLRSSDFMPRSSQGLEAGDHSEPGLGDWDRRKGATEVRAALPSLDSGCRDRGSQLQVEAKCCKSLSIR